MQLNREVSSAYPNPRLNVVKNISPCLQIPSSPFMKRLGFGSGVNVYLIDRSPKLGKLMSPWAIKKVSKHSGTECTTYVARLKEEALILKELNHENIVGFRSFLQSTDGCYCLAMEDGEKSLLTMIEFRRENDLGPFSHCSVLKVAMDAANALCYLHVQRHLLHGDLKSANVLVKGEMESVKICDFGVTIPLNEEGFSLDEEACYIGTEPWTCKEALEGKRISDKADIYAYGLVVYEMLTLEMPHMHVFPDESDFPGDLDAFDKAFQLAEVQYRQSLGSRPPLVNFGLDASYSTAIELYWACTHESPEHRPSATQIYTGLLVEADVLLPDPKCKLEF